MNLRQIEVFRTIMLTGSFTAAARLLHVSQPSISRVARHLEIQLGVDLFERQRGKIQTTPEARALSEEIERNFRGVRAIQTFANELKSGACTPLRVVTSPSLGMEVLPAAVADLFPMQAGVSLSHEVLARRAQLIDVLLTEQADLVFSAVELDHVLLDADRLGVWRLVCAFPSNHPLAGKGAVSIKDVIAYPLIAFHTETLQGKIINEWLAGVGASITKSVQVRSGQVACGFVLKGLGVAIVDNLTAAAFAPNGLEFRVMKETVEFPIDAVWNVNRPLSKLAQRLVARVKQHLPE